VIRVDGPRETGYTKVVSGTTKLHVSVRSDRPKRTVRGGLFSVRVGGGSAGGQLTESWTKYEISFPYKAPLDSTTDTANDRFDPVAFCNAKLRRAKGDQRARFLKKGSRTTLHDAYALKGEVVWTVKKGQFSENKTNVRRATAPAAIRCMPLDRARARARSGTTTQNTDDDKARRQARERKPQRTAPPAVRELTLRMEPSKNVRIAGQSCPTKLQLYGGVAASRPFKGKAAFVGAG